MAKQKDKHLIWQKDIDYEDWRADMENEFPDMSEEERYDVAVETNYDYLGDEHINLSDVFEGKDVIMIGSLYRWTGAHRWVVDYDNTSSEKVLRGQGRDIELVEASVQRSSDSGKYELIERFGHHDDNFSSSFLYVRIKKDNLSERQNERCDKIIRDYLYEHKIDLKEALKELDTYTYSPSKEIANVYGWKLSRSPRKKKTQENEQGKTASVLEQ